MILAISVHTSLPCIHVTFETDPFTFDTIHIKQSGTLTLGDASTFGQLTPKASDIYHGLYLADGFGITQIHLYFI
jgi:hypothetical protein